MLRCLDCEEVRNSVSLIGPEIGGDLFRGTEARVEVISDRLRVETELKCPRPVDVGDKVRGIDLWLQRDMGDPRNARRPPPQLPRPPPVRGAVSADHASVNLRREPEIEN